MTIFHAYSTYPRSLYLHNRGVLGIQTSDFALRGRLVRMDRNPTS